MIPYIKQKQDMLALMFILRIIWIVKGSCYIAKHSQGLVNRAVRCFRMIQTSLQSEGSLNGTCSLLYEGLSNNDSMLLLILHPAACVLDHFLQSNKPSPFERMAVLHHPNPPSSPPLTSQIQHPHCHALIYYSHLCCQHRSLFLTRQKRSLPWRQQPMIHHLSGPSLCEVSLRYLTACGVFKNILRDGNLRWSPADGNGGDVL